MARQIARNQCAETLEEMYGLIRTIRTHTNKSYKISLYCRAELLHNNVVEIADGKIKSVLSGEAAIQHNVFRDWPFSQIILLSHGTPPTVRDAEEPEVDETTSSVATDGDSSATEDSSDDDVVLVS